LRLAGADTMSFRITSSATWWRRSAAGSWSPRRVVPILTRTAIQAGQCRRFGARATAGIFSGGVGVGSRSSLPNRAPTAASVTGVRCRCSRRTSAARPATPTLPITADRLPGPGLWYAEHFHNAGSPRQADLTGAVGLGVSFAGGAGPLGVARDGTVETVDCGLDCGLLKGVEIESAYV
jgi:hypothetical protein